jgi:glycosyltransferase involved in cell wall biosynthesis
MKVALVCNRFFPYIGGVETVVFELASRLAKLGVDVTVLTQTENSLLEKSEHKENFTIKRFREYGFSNIKISFGILKYLQQNSASFDLIHSHNYHTFPALCVSLTKRTLTVFSPHYHGSGQNPLTKLLHYPYRLIGYFIFSKTDKVLCDTDAESKLLKEHFPNVKDTLTIPLGIDVDQIQKTSKSKKTLKYILSIGRLEKYKNFDLIISSIKFINDSHLVIVGDGPELNRLKLLIDKLDLNHRVLITKNISKKELFNLISNADTYISMSELEAYGLSVLEGIAANKKIIASDISAHRELIKLFKVNNIVLTDIDIEPVNLARLIVSSTLKPAFANKQLPSWDFVTKRTLDVYKSLINRDIKSIKV